MSALSLGPLPFVALTLSIPILGAGSSELDDPFVIVDTEMGAVQGRRFDGYNAFLGIPYGESTAGASRFTLPVPKQPWAPKTLNATNFRDGCAGGNHRRTKSKVNISFTEDCLHINIWAPARVPKNGAPVVVYIHGGGFQSGTASDPIYDSRHYAEHGLIAVTFEYRLGPFGFMTAPGIPANLGIRDQQLALRWVAKHIVSFGGDKDRVTVHGQSAGAMSTLVHLVSPGSAGLFHAAIIRSPVGLHYLTPEEALGHAKTMATVCKCNVTDLECLRKTSYKYLVDTELIPEYAEHLRTPGEGINFLQWIPTVDKEIIPDQPLKLLRAGNFTRMPVIIGSVKNETDAFLPAPTSGPLDALMLDGFLELQFDSNKTLRDAVKKIYPKAMGNGQQRTMRWSTDLLMRCYVKRLADAFVSKKCSSSSSSSSEPSSFMARITGDESSSSSSSSDVYVYEFMHSNSPQADPTNAKMKICTAGNACCHAGDNVYAFGTQDVVPGVSFTSYEQRLAAKLVDTFVEFAMNSGSPALSSSSSKNLASPPPGPGGLVAYEAVGRRYGKWGVGENADDELLEVAENYGKDSMCEFWENEDVPPHLLA